MKELWTVLLGTVEYRAALELQERVRAARRADALPDTLLLLEHPPVYTRGRRSDPSELAMGEAFYRAKGIDIVEVRRGGKVTYHGPGQLVGYPIVRVDDVVAFVRTMERALSAALADAGLPGAAGRPDDGPDFTGVWIERTRKIASIGIHVRQGVSAHGFAVNVDNDLAPFGWVVACGLPDVQMTSFAQETGRRDAMPCLRRAAADRLARELGARQRLVTPQALERALAAFEVGQTPGAQSRDAPTAAAGDAPAAPAGEAAPLAEADAAQGQRPSLASARR